MRIQLAIAMLCVAQFARAGDSSALYAAELIDLNGKPYAGDKLRGKPLVVNFWARWCAPCKEEIPDLIEADAKYRSRGVATVGVGIDERLEGVREFAKTQGIDYTLLLAVGQGIGLLRAVGNSSGGLPYTMVIDRAGRVVARHLGVMSKAEMDAAFRLALGP